MPKEFRQWNVLRDEACGLDSASKAVSSHDNAFDQVTFLSDFTKSNGDLMNPERDNKDILHKTDSLSLPYQPFSSKNAFLMQPNAMAMLDSNKLYTQNSLPPSLPLASPLSNSAKKSANSFPLACSFEAFSHHFHLPLKVAAEKFGVRATAFKKRCRAIGIRHWPYRKVRSLKRSLQELSRCKDEGTINEKQKHQYQNFKSQLDKLLSAETYGIDPHKRVVRFNFNDDDDTLESGDEDSSTSSPHVQATFTECSITSIKLNDKHARPYSRKGRRSKKFGHKSMSPSGHTNIKSDTMNSDPMASVSVRFGQANEFNFDSYESLFGEFKRESHVELEDFTAADYSGGQCFIDTSISAQDDFFLPSLRSPTNMSSYGSSAQFSIGQMTQLSMPSLHSTSNTFTNSTLVTTSAAAPISPTNSSSVFASHGNSASDNNNTTSIPMAPSDHLFDDEDMFLQLSPDCGCIV